MMETAAQTTPETPVKTWEDGLKGRIRTFVLLYCTDEECFLNGTRTYKKAYAKKDPETGKLVAPSDEVAGVSASRLLGNVRVKESIRMLLRLARDETDEEAVYRLIKQYERMAFYNSAEIINANGDLIVTELSELGPLAACIAQIEKKITSQGDVIRNIKLVDRRPYMQDLGKYLNIIRPENQTAVNVPIIMMTSKDSLASWGVHPAAQGGEADGNSEPDAQDSDPA